MASAAGGPPHDPELALHTPPPPASYQAARHGVGRHDGLGLGLQRGFGHGGCGGRAGGRERAGTTVGERRRRAHTQRLAHSRLHVPRLCVKLRAGAWERPLQRTDAEESW